MEDVTQLRDQIQRCRRLARSINDASARDSLERLAQDYEGQLPTTDAANAAAIESP